MCEPGRREGVTALVMRDPRFWAAIAAGPVACLLLSVLPAVPLRPQLPEPTFAFVLVIAVYPLLEEWLFRGEVQPFLARRLDMAIGPLTLANTATSALFAALHLLFHPPGWAAAVFLPSLIFGYFRERSGGLAAPMILHATYNTAYFLLLGGY